MDPNILSIILYGSHARKDHDELSDCDICIITRDKKNEKLEIDDLEKMLGASVSSEINLVYYSDAVVNSMLSHGSLFLWHLKLEGKVLYGAKYLSDKFHRLTRFKTHHEEVKYHAELFHDLKRSWELLSIVNELDLSLLFTIVRNTCMVLSHKAGKPSFGRVSSFYSAKKFFSNLPISIGEYKYLSRWKLLYEREIETVAPLPTTDKFIAILHNIHEFIQFALKKVALNA